MGTIAKYTSEVTYHVTAVQSLYVTTIFVNKHWHHQVDKSFYLGDKQVAKSRSIVLEFFKALLNIKIGLGFNRAASLNRTGQIGIKGS